MGMASMSSNGESLKLCVFDLRRGQNEGQELDKILFFYPPDVTFSTQLSVIGLSEGLITFTRLFSPEAACEVIEAERHSHIFHEAEPDIWMVMVVEKNKEIEAIWRVDALQKVLKEVHSLFVMFHGSVRSLLDKEPSGGLIRSHLYPFITDYLNGKHTISPPVPAHYIPVLYLLSKRFLLCMSDLSVGKKLQLPSFRETLKERGTVQMLTLARDAALEVQSLVGVLDSCAGTLRCHSVILFHDLLVSTTLSPDDTVDLFTFSVMRLTSNALSSGTSSWSYLRKGTSLSQTSSRSTSPQLLVSSDSLPSGNGNDAGRVIRPLQHNKWSKGKDGFLVTDIWGKDATPTIWLQQREERVHLLAYQHKCLTLVLLVPTEAIVNGELDISFVKHQVTENASAKILKVEEKLSKGWGGENAYHVSGYRYLLVDNDMEVSRASPSGKVATLAKETLLAVNKLRETVDTEKSRTKEEKDMEICIRAKNNAWAIARVTRGKELYMALEKASDTLLDATDSVQSFSNRYCNGTFSMD
ncbi:vacuolar fusion protein CCZ1 homolog B isoform X1 [Brassica rapa]|uniref:vacuolar fusion protein CCZ1 homolog B isoform X1 n=1 Tax=Brassica campestris TaxID=3711 RepID=UPI0004F1711C|nr:vacuolar fusion protein CCZ1 homolog B isoform X1 [Brassica rapa]